MSKTLQPRHPFIPVPPALLKRCPFCNTHNLTVDCNIAAWWVHCQECQADGPASHRREAAIKEWNEGCQSSALVADRTTNRDDLKKIEP